MISSLPPFTRLVNASPCAAVHSRHFCELSVCTNFLRHSGIEWLVMAQMTVLQLTPVEGQEVVGGAVFENKL